MASFTTDSDRFMFATASFDMTLEELERDFEELDPTQLEHGLQQIFARSDYLEGVLIRTSISVLDGVVDAITLRHETMIAEFANSLQENEE